MLRLRFDAMGFEEAVVAGELEVTRDPLCDAPASQNIDLRLEEPLSLLRVGDLLEVFGPKNLHRLIVDLDTRRRTVNWIAEEKAHHSQCNAGRQHRGNEPPIAPDRRPNLLDVDAVVRALPPP
jgi:hypothetical protein